MSPTAGAGPAQRIGVLVMAYGTPAAPEEIEAYYTHIRRGRAPAPEQLAELCARYEAIGGTSPLRKITRAQVQGLRGALARAGHQDLPIALGYKHSAPFIEDAVDELARAGVGHIAGIVLAPHFSAMSVGEYAERAATAAARAEQPPTVSVVHDWHLSEPYLDLLAERVRAELAGLTAGDHREVPVLFTAHSLPTRILASGDPYPTQLREIAWQSAGRTPEPWIGPDVLDAIATLAARGERAVVVCAAGFVADHLEVLYDLDVEARGRAAELGIEFARTASPNDAPEIAEALAGALLADLRSVRA
jgi:ferrochelatase